MQQIKILQNQCQLDNWEPLSNECLKELMKTDPSLWNRQLPQNSFIKNENSNL